MYCLKCEDKDGELVEMDKETFVTNDPSLEVTYFICGACGYETEDLKEVDEDDRLIE